MSLFKGFAELQTPWDLVRKLEYDLARLENLPQDQYAAFDFFVTADHMVDWIYPANKTERTRIRSSSPLLKITSHIANGAKHFKATANHHRSVADVEKYRIVEPGCVEEGCFEEPVIVHLTVEEEESIGQATIEAVQLAKLVLEYWRTNAPKP